MIYRIALIVCLSVSPQALSQDCPPSNLTDSWAVGTAITQIVLGSLQVLGASASFIADFIFYKKTSHQRILDLKKELEELREENHALKLEIPKVTLEILDLLYEHITQNPYDIESNADLAKLFSELEKTLTEFADEYNENIPITDGDLAGAPPRTGRFVRWCGPIKKRLCCTSSPPSKQQD